MAANPTLLDSPAVVDMRLEPVRPAELDAVSVFERLARDPSVDVDKLDRLMQMHERVTAKQAEGLFNAAMSDGQIGHRDRDVRLHERTPLPSRTVTSRTWRRDASARGRTRPR